jgi:hypothetical protein
MYAPQTARQLEMPPAAAGDDEAFLSTQQIWAERDGISLVTQCDVVRLPPATVDTEKRQYWSAGNVRYSRPADRSVGRNARSGLRNSVNQAASLEHGFRG